MPAMRLRNALAGYQLNVIQHHLIFKTYRYLNHGINTYAIPILQNENLTDVGV